MVDLEVGLNGVGLEKKACLGGRSRRARAADGRCGSARAVRVQVGEGVEGFLRAVRGVRKASPRPQGSMRGCCRRAGWCVGGVEVVGGRVEVAVGRGEVVEGRGIYLKGAW